MPEHEQFDEALGVGAPQAVAELQVDVEAHHLNLPVVSLSVGSGTRSLRRIE